VFNGGENMKSIKFAWGLLVIVVGFLVLGIGNMVWTSMSDAPYTIETSAEGNQYLKGTVFEVGKEGAGKLSNNVSTSAIIDGKVEKLFQTLGTWNGQMREQVTLSKIPLLERSLLVNHRHVLQLDNSSLFYDIHWDSYFSNSGDFTFNYAMYSNENKRIIEKQIPIHFTGSFGWGEEPIFQRKGKELGVIIPFVEKKSSERKFLKFIVSFEEGTVKDVGELTLEKDGLWINAAFGNHSYNPETIVFNVLPLKDGPKSSKKPEEDEYYQYDLFTNTFRKLDISSLGSPANFYISGSKIYAVETNLPKFAGRKHGRPDPAERPGYIENSERQANNETVYQLTSDLSLEKIGTIQRDPYSSEEVLNKDTLVYVGLDQGQDALRVFDLNKKEEVFSAKITPKADAKLYFQRNREYVIY
jgi:hypothetical protein